MNDVIDIFYKYSINHKLLDRYAVSKILDIVLKTNGFDNKISYIITKDDKISLSNSNILGEFDMDSIIYIYYWEMLKSIRKNKHLTKFDHYYELNNTDIMFKKNMLILETIFHEIEHVKQFEIVKDIFNKSLESKIYQYEINYIHPTDDIIDMGIWRYYIEFLKHEIIYARNYHISFMERMANIKAMEEIYNLLVSLGKDFNKLYGIQSYVINDYLTKQYQDDLIGPTIRFISNIGYMYEFNEQGLGCIVDRMNIDERIRYGFNITEEEYKKRIKR